MGVITKGSSLCRGLKNPRLGPNLHNHKPQSWEEKSKTLIPEDYRNNRFGGLERIQIISPAPVFYKMKKPKASMTGMCPFVYIGYRPKTRT